MKKLRIKIIGIIRRFKLAIRVMRVGKRALYKKNNSNKNVKSFSKYRKEIGHELVLLDSKIEQAVTFLCGLIDRKEDKKELDYE